MIELADQVQAMHGTGAVFALAIGDCEPDQRMTVINHHQAAMNLLRRRGHRVRGNVIYDEDGIETITLRIDPGPMWRTLDA